MADRHQRSSEPVSRVEHEQDYQNQLRLLEIQNRRRLQVAREEQRLEELDRGAHAPLVNMPEKQGLLPETAPVLHRPQRAPLRAWRIYLHMTVLCLLLAAFVHSPAQSLKLSSCLKCTTSSRMTPTASKPDPHFAWEDIPTLPELKYVPCYFDEYYCARLELPLDYWNGTTDKTISLAVIKYPASVSVDHPDYKGPILINPGGPSGSGVEFAFKSGSILQSIVQGDFPSTNDVRHYDIVGFDPRGVGLTLPRVDCSDSIQHSESWRLRGMEEGILTSSDAALGRQWSMMKATAGRCSDVDEFHIQRYLSTASVARDMLELVEASARWRRKELEALGSSILVKPESEKLQYWGFSYGSYLGNSFAALFPDRVGRLIVDGVVDAYDYSRNQWFDNLEDTEKDMDLFYYHCARVGYPKCALADQHDPTPFKVKVRKEGIIARMWHTPIAVIEPYAEVVSWSDVRSLIFAALYSPVGGFPYVANVLAELERGDGTLLASLLQSYHSFTCPNDASTRDSLPLRNDSFHFRPNDPFTFAAILCADGDPQQWMTRQIFEQHLINSTALSPTIGDIWAGIKLPCIGYALRPLHRFPGPFKGDTSHPLLMIGNTADPVTPLNAAKLMVKGYKDAVVLTQNSPGHCSLAGFSPCTFNYIHEYFFNGTLPPKGTVCESLSKPFGPGPGDIDMLDEIKIASAAHADVAKAMMEVGGGIGNGFGRINLQALS